MKSFRQSCVPFRRLGVFLVVLLLSTIVPSAAWSQTVSGSIEGYVYDATGAVIPDVSVEALNTENGARRTVTTNNQGYYFLGQLPADNYELRLMRSGFTELRYTNIQLHVGDLLKIDATLQVAGVQAEIIVTETAPLIEPSQTGTATVIVESEIRELPVNNRNWTDLALLIPGVAVDAEFDSVASVSINGVEGNFNNVQVDGVDNNNAFFGELRGRTRAPFQFSQETVKEFRVLTNAFSAEYGRAAGGIINAITKSGTNDFHGSAFWYIRDDAFNATPFFVNASPRVDKADSRRQQFGGTIGGPIMRDKVFFFFSYDQQVRRDPVAIILDTSTRRDLDFNPLDIFNLSSFESGSNSFTDAVDGTGSRTLINDPTTGFSSFHTDIIHQAFLNWAFARAYFLGDSSLLDRTFTTAGGMIQTINPFPGRSFSSIERNVRRDRDQVNFFPKITWLVNQNNTFNFQWNFQDFQSGPNGIFTNPTKTDNQSADATENNESDSLVFSLNSVITPHLLNEARFQFVRDDAVSDTNAPGVPEFDINSFDFGSQGFVPRFTKENRYQWQDNFTIIRGRHQIKTGLDILWTEDDNFFPGDFNGQYRFNGPGNFIELSRRFIADTQTFTDGLNYFGIDLGDGSGPRSPNAARFTVRNYQQRFGRTTTNQTTLDYGFYVQDNIRLRPDFTLYLGVRYEFQQFEDPVLPNPLVPETARINEDTNNWAPRIGLAWSPRHNLVIRAGYGLYYIRTAQLDVDNAIKNNNAFSFNQFLSGSATDAAGLLAFNPAALDPLNLTDSDFPNLNAPTTACPSPPACADPFASVNFFAPDRQNGYTQQSNLEIQWEFTPGTSVSVGYIHTKGTSLPRNRNVNVLDAAFGQANARTFTFVDGSGNTIAVASVPDYRAFSTSNRPDPNFSAKNVNESGASSFYNAFVLKLERRMRNGLMFGTSYTLSKNVTDISNGFNSSGTFFSDVFDQNNVRLDRGLSRLDHRHRFVVRGVWEIPYGGNGGAGMRAALKGWSLGMIYTARTGLALTPVVNADITNDNARTAFGDGDRVPFLARGSFTTQGRNNTDLSVYKRFRFGEQYSLQFRAQAFNIFNRVAFTRFDDRMFFIDNNFLSAPTATLNPNFLEPEGRARRNRDIQLGLVLRF